MKRKGIILSGGTATRLFPTTSVLSKQVLPIYDKPMIYYPLSTLLQAKITEILIISTPRDTALFQNLLGDGSRFGVNLNYLVQDEPKGIAHSLIIAEEFLEKAPCVLILGDNIFHGNKLSNQLIRAGQETKKCTIFGYRVNDPERYGVIKFDKDMKPVGFIEKPEKFVSNHAVTGLYFYPAGVSNLAKELRPSNRGELEITDLNQLFLNNALINVSIFDEGIVWLDTGTSDSLFDASSYVAAVQRRQGYLISCPEEISLKNKLVSKQSVKKYAESIKNSDYGKYLLKISR